MSSNSLYGAPRPKNKPIPLSSTSIHALATELSLARSTATKSAPARPRPSKSSKLFHNKGVDTRAERDLQSPFGKTTRELGGNVSEHDLDRSKRRMQEKAKLYAKLKRGEVSGEGALVDFDRKWAENGERDDEDDDDDEEAAVEDDGVLVEYLDEFGRSRTGTKVEAAAAEREKAAATATAKAAGEMEESARPPPPANVMYGNMIQTHAFQTPEFSTVPAGADLAGLLPTEEESLAAEEAHYDASKEVRTKGVGFYQFSKDAGARKAEMEELEKERERTERERKEKEERRKRKREELEKRKEQVRAKRRVKVGGSWLEDQFGGLKEE